LVLPVTLEVQVEGVFKAEEDNRYGRCGDIVLLEAAWPLMAIPVGADEISES
jgi:hypothetical protein